jgi:hypothetical protein
LFGNRTVWNDTPVFDLPTALYLIRLLFICIIRDIMTEGGNAMDAAIAALFCNGVVNPQSAGIGGGFHMTIYDPATQTAKCLDARETAPLAATENMYSSNAFLSQIGEENKIPSIPHARRPSLTQRIFFFFDYTKRRFGRRRTGRIGRLLGRPSSVRPIALGSFSPAGRPAGRERSRSQQPLGRHSANQSRFHQGRTFHVV